MLVSKRRSELYSSVAILVMLVIWLSGCKAPVSTKPDTTPPSEVSSLSLLAGDRAVEFSWNDPLEADLDYIELQMVPSSGQGTIVGPGVGTALITNLDNGTEYTFLVQSVDNAGNHSPGLSRSGTPGAADAADTTAPGEVSGLLAFPGDRQLALSWTPPVDIDCDRIIITHDQFGGDTPVEIPKYQTSIVYAGLANGTSYTFSVRTGDISDNLSSGITVSETPLAPADAVAPGPVSELAASSGNGQASLSWLDPADPDINYIQISNDVSSDVLIIPAGLQEAVIGGLTNGESYTFTLRVVDTSTNLSLPVSTVAQPLNSGDTTPPASPSSVVATPGDSRVVLSWVDPTDADLNHIAITHDQPGGSSPVVVAAGALGATLYGLTNDLLYTFTVRAVDEAGNYSSAASVQATPVSTTDNLGISLSLDLPGDETVVSSGELAVLYIGASPILMTVTASLDGASSYAWYLDGYQIGSDSSSVTVSTSYLVPNPPYPLAAGLHSLTAIIVKNGLQYDREIQFDVRNNN